MNRPFCIILLVAAGFLFSSIGGPLISGADAGDVFYFCKNKKQPCVTLTKDGCADCPKDLKEIEVSLHNIMGVLNGMRGSFKKNAKKGNEPMLTQLAESISVLSELVATQTPKKGRDNLENFKSLAGELKIRAEAVAGQAKDGADKSYMAYKNFEALCSVCHKSYR